jgi:hypothetical protein
LIRIQRRVRNCRCVNRLSRECPALQPLAELCQHLDQPILVLTLGQANSCALRQPAQLRQKRLRIDLNRLGTARLLAFGHEARQVLPQITSHALAEVEAQPGASVGTANSSQRLHTLVAATIAGMWWMPAIHVGDGWDGSETISRGVISRGSSSPSSPPMSRFNRPAASRSQLMAPGVALQAGRKFWQYSWASLSVPSSMNGGADGSSIRSPKSSDRTYGF